MRGVENRALQAYRDVFGPEPEIVANAPGRINLIGEHTDYNGGFVLPCAIDRRVATVMGRAPGWLFSADFDELRPIADSPRSGTWADYPSGVAWALRQAGLRAHPFRAAFAGNVPRGAGLSSSAAIEGATALALNELFGLGIPRPELAVLCRRAENGFVGVNSGIMDQYTSLMCEEGFCLLIDCRSLNSRNVPLDLDGADLTLLVCDTRAERALAATGYNNRRAVCERAAAQLGVAQLRDALPEDLERLRGEELMRARHVVTENARVLEAVGALERDDFETLGRLMYASHASLRDDYEVSTPPLNAFVELGREGGAIGARLTGAGFGGCAIALIAPELVDALKADVRRAFADSGFVEPSFYSFRPAAGAEVHRLSR
jgi:galactokinase